MERDKYSHLLTWKQAKSRKPLILRGARQVGKTHLLKTFGAKEYESMVYLNFETDPKLQEFFNGRLDPKLIIENLEVYIGRDIHPGKTLLIFDEIQESPSALNSLKYFCEELPQMHVAAAGSLLGVKLSKEKGFPVGKVNFIDLYPMTFFEFLNSIGKNRFKQNLLNINKIEPIPEPIHHELLELLKKYFLIGGMPEAVSTYIDSQNLNAVRQVHRDILDAYTLDFAKHAPSSQIAKLSAVWLSIPSQLARENKKFMFSAIRKSARGRDYEDAIHWLADAGLIHRSFNISAPRLPLDSYGNVDAFKVFLLDVGLLATMSRVPMQAILKPHELFTEFKGAFTENFVAQELAAQHFGSFYWTSQGAAEVDFIVEHEARVFPLEVKAGVSHHQKSLRVYDEKFQPAILLRASILNLKQDGKLINIPLYFLGRIFSLL